MRLKIIFIMVIGLMFSCNDDKFQLERIDRLHRELDDYTKKYKTVEIEGCEYIMITDYRVGFMAHKGKCKNCN